MENTYFSNYSINNIIVIGKKIYETSFKIINLNARMYSSDTYFDADIKVLWAWGKTDNGFITEPRMDVTVLNKYYENTTDNILTSPNPE